MTDFIETYDIPTSLCKSLIEDFNYRKGIQREAALSRGYSYVHSVDMNSALIGIYEEEIHNIVYKYVHKFNLQKRHCTIFSCQPPTTFNFTRLVTTILYGIVKITVIRSTVTAI